MSAPHCFVCQKAFDHTKDTVIKVATQQLHQECFLCVFCNRSLVGQQPYPGPDFSTKGRFQCTSCWGQCPGCGKETVGERIEDNGKKWHPDCWPDKCAKCGKSAYEDIIRREGVGILHPECS